MIELFQFQFSTFCEKARWAFDYKGIPYTPRDILPGPHVPVIFWHSGQKSVPVMRENGKILAGSGRILERLDEIKAEPPLLPRDAGQARQVLDMQRWLDEEVGPHIRRAFFFELLQCGSYAARAMSFGADANTRAWYVRSFPLLAPVIKVDMKITAAGAERGRAVTRAALDFVSKQCAAGGYLVGDQFSLADLTAAALLMPVVFPPEFVIQLEQPLPEPMRRWLGYWSDHPASAWVREMYRRHRHAT